MWLFQNHADVLTGTVANEHKKRAGRTRTTLDIVLSTAPQALLRRQPTYVQLAAATAATHWGRKTGIRTNCLEQRVITKTRKNVL